ncbi:MAG: hypothetical protein HS115_03640 [Spirochaetales bacterium]|nr:hypothetical protein [Spirochaetales bacterium]
MLHNQTLDAPLLAGSASRRTPFWLKLLGSDVALWGIETGTLMPGFLGRAPYLHPFLGITFDFQSQLEEKESRAAIAALKTVLAQGWHHFKPYEYNTAVAATEFMEEFLRCLPLIRKGESVSDWIKRTEKMQIAYARLRQYQGFREFLCIELPAWLEKHEKMLPFAEPCRKVMNTLARYDSRNPRLVDTIVAHYSLKLDQLVHWKDLQKGWNVGEPVSARYQAPDSVKPIIDEHVAALKSKTNHIESKLQEIDTISREYLHLDASGRAVREDFAGRLNSLAAALRGSGINSVESLSRPLPLLFFLLKDFDVTYRPLLSGLIRVAPERSGSTFEDVFVFKPDLFRGVLESLQLVLSSADRAVSKYKELNEYSFEDLARDLQSDKEIADQLRRHLVDLVHRSVVFFRRLGADLDTIIQNHRLALKEEWSGRRSEELTASARTPMEKLDKGIRYIPYHSRTLLVNTRLRGLKIEEVLRDLLIDTFYFRYVFQDAELRDFLSSAGSMRSQLEDIAAQLQHY